MTIDLSVILDNWGLFAHGALVTLVVAAGALVLAAALAVPLALLALSKRAWHRWIAAIYLECFRNLPFIVVVYIFFYGLPMLQVRLPQAVLGTVALGCFAASYLSEIIRGAILSVPKGQLEAARAVGMSYARGMWEIVAPQTLRFLMPPATSTSISMIKETSVLSVITVNELTYQGLIVQGNTFAPFEVFLTTAALYWFMTAVFARVMRRAEGLHGAAKSAASSRASLADQYLKIDA
jgi:His/Glu/Gln/Arg/opine family amino acid ABC transporter permease subunit